MMTVPVTTTMAFMLIWFAVVTPVFAVFYTMTVIVSVGPRLINYNLISPIQIIVSISRRKMGRKNPIAS